MNNNSLISSRSFAARQTRCTKDVVRQDNRIQDRFSSQPVAYNIWINWWRYYGLLFLYSNNNNDVMHVIQCNCCGIKWHSDLQQLCNAMRTQVLWFFGSLLSISLCSSLCVLRFCLQVRENWMISILCYRMWFVVVVDDLIASEDVTASSLLTYFHQRRRCYTAILRKRRTGPSHILWMYHHIYFMHPPPTHRILFVSGSALFALIWVCVRPDGTIFI